MPVHKTEIRVRFGDTDMAGVVYVPRYIHYFVCAFEEFFRSIGVPIEQTITNEIKGFPPTEIKCRFKAPAYCGDLLEVHTRVANVFKKGITFEFDLFRKADKRLLATGTFTNVSINEKRKAVALPALPEYILEAVNKFEQF